MSSSPSKENAYNEPTAFLCGRSQLTGVDVETSVSLHPDICRGLNEENTMQFLEVSKGSIFISQTMPIDLLSKAVLLIESTVVEDGVAVEVHSFDGFFQVSGEGEVNDIEPLISGLDIIRPYVEQGCSIDVNNHRWETKVCLSSPPPN